MPNYLTLLSWIIAAFPIVALGWFALEVLCGLKARSPAAATTGSPRVAILIPAHNEGAGVGETVMMLKRDLPKGARILVVADNCSDDTAVHARSAGAVVIERSNPDLRGKGYALAFGRDHLALDPPDVVIVIDADCQFVPGSISALANAVIASGRPAQACNLIEPDHGVSPLVQLSSFAMVVKNLVRLRGMGRLGDCALLCGTGMAFPWLHFAAAPLATDDLVEDLGLGISMIRKGISPQLVEAARVTSRPAAREDSITQRSRWEHGFLSTALRHALPTLWQGLTTGSRGCIALGMHLLVPPLALLFVLAGMVLGALALVAWLGSSWMAFVTVLAFMLVALLAVAFAWLAEGRATLSARALASAPLYVLWKIPIYLRFLRGPETSWVRTRRDGEQG